MIYMYVPVTKRVSNKILTLPIGLLVIFLFLLAYILSSHEIAIYRAWGRVMMSFSLWIPLIHLIFLGLGKRLGSFTSLFKKSSD